MMLMESDPFRRSASLRSERSMEKGQRVKACIYDLTLQCVMKLYRYHMAG